MNNVKDDFLKALEEGKATALKFNATLTAKCYDTLIEKEKKRLENEANKTKKL